MDMMIINLLIHPAGDLSAVMVANQIGRLTRLPYEVVSRGNNDERVDLSLEVPDDCVMEGVIDAPFNE